MPRLTVYVSDRTDDKARTMARAKGQTLSTWVERAIIVATTEDGQDLVEKFYAQVQKMVLEKEE